MFIAKKVLLVAVLCVGASVMAADVVSDTIRLTEGGVNKDVILAWAQQQPAFQASAENIIALKDHKVSDDVILALIKGNENTPLNVAPLSTKTVTDHGWLRKSDATIAARRVADQPTTEQAPVQSEPQVIAPATTTYVQPATYVVPSTVTYIDAGYPVYYGGYPYYSSYYGGYPYYSGVSIGFSFGGRYGYCGNGYRGGYYGGYHGGYGGYHGGGGYYSGGYHGGSGYSYGRGSGGFSRGGGRR